MDHSKLVSMGHIIIVEEPKEHSHELAMAMAMAVHKDTLVTCITPAEAKERGITISQSNTAFEPDPIPIHCTHQFPAYIEEREPKNYINGKKKYRKKY